jgi:hypothetical protein
MRKTRVNTEPASLLAVWQLLLVPTRGYRCTYLIPQRYDQGPPCGLLLAESRTLFVWMVNQTVSQDGNFDPLPGARRSAHSDAATAEVVLQLRDVDHVEVKHGRCQQDRGASFDSLVEVLQRARASRSHDLGGRGFVYRADDGQIVAGLRSIASLAGGEDYRHAE